jgi:hypothetical protein
VLNRGQLRRWHVWLGWIIAVPMLLWTLSGIVMVARPIEEVRGTGLLRDPQPFRLTAPPVTPLVEGRPLARLTLEPRAAGPRWVLGFADGGSRLADPATGALLPPMSAADAAREVAARYTGTASIQGATRTDRSDPPLELRRPIDSWQIRMSDGTRFYVDMHSGEIVARRTGWWRFYDFMWGLHIMDPGGREDTHNPFVIGFGLIAAVTTVLAIILLPLVTRWKRNGSKKRPRKAEARRAD